MPGWKFAKGGGVGHALFPGGGGDNRNAEEKLLHLQNESQMTYAVRAKPQC